MVTVAYSHTETYRRLKTGEPIRRRRRPRVLSAGCYIAGLFNRRSRFEEHTLRCFVKADLKSLEEIPAA